MCQLMLLTCFCVCMCVCVYILCVYIHKCTHMHVYTYIDHWMHTHEFLYICVCMFVCHKGGDGYQHYKVRARLAVFNKHFKEAESIYLEGVIIPGSFFVQIMSML